jgi:hypothetical protein
MNNRPRSLFAVLQLHFPDPGSPMGEPGRPVPAVEVAAFQADLAAITRRLRWKMSLVTGVVLAWFAVQLIVALLAKNPYASVVALGTAGGGALWCVNFLLRLSKQVFFAEILVAAATQSEEFLHELVKLAREQLRGTQSVAGSSRSPRRPGAGRAGKRVSPAAAAALPAASRD